MAANCWSCYALRFCGLTLASWLKDTGIHARRSGVCFPRRFNLHGVADGSPPLQVFSELYYPGAKPW